MGIVDLFVKKSGDSEKASEDPAEEIARIMRDSKMTPQTPSRESLGVPASQYREPKPSNLSARPVSDPAQTSLQDIYGQAGIAPAALERTGRVISLMGQLAGLEPSARKAAVVASISTFGIQPEEVSQTSYRQVQALDGWTRLVAGHTATQLTNRQEKIAALKRQVDQEEAALDQLRRAQQDFDNRTKITKEAVLQVIEFFNNNLSPNGR